MDWARERVRLDAERGDAQAIIQLLEPLPENVSGEFLPWAQIQLARAELALGRGKLVRLRLARLIWSGTEDKDALAQGRRLLIRSYLQEGLAEDAYITMVRYQQDIGGEDVDWLALRAEVLLASQRPADAAALLAGQSVPALRALYLIAAYRTAALSPLAVSQAARDFAVAEGVPVEVQRRLWSLVWDATVDHEDAAAALEQLLVLGTGAPDPLVSITSADTLWRSYEDCGRILGAQAQLPDVDVLPWLEAARRVEGQRPVEARCLLAYGMTVASPELSALVHAEFSRLCLAQSGGQALLWQLYMSSQRYRGVEAVPAIVRYALADLALDQGDMGLAFRLASDLNQPPPGIDAGFWKIRRARFMIAGGSHELGITALQSLMQEQGTLDRDQAVGALKAIFDILALGQYEAAAEVLTALSTRAGDPELQSQALYWLADSRRAQGQYAEAATLWLRMAGDAQDAWAQTARYAAADALALAGLTDDARRVLAGLVAHASDPVLRASAQRRLESLGVGR